MNIFQTLLEAGLEQETGVALNDPAEEQEVGEETPAETNETPAEEIPAEEEEVASDIKADLKDLIMTILDSLESEMLAQGEELEEEESPDVALEIIYKLIPELSDTQCQMIADKLSEYYDIELGEGYNDGKVVVETKVETTGEPAAAQLKPDRSTINADGEDVSVITVSVRDAQNRVVPTAANLVHFDLSGPGKILGVGNGDPSCHEPDVYLPTLMTHTVALNDGWRWKKVSNVYDSNLPEIKTNFDDSSWETADVQAASGPLRERAQAVYRAKIQVTPEELAAESVELCFSMIDEDGWVYVNGQKVGESHDWSSAPAFDVKHILHPGENDIAVAVANWSGPGGINKGVTLRMQDKPILPEWKRSVFNGLAQIIVQSTKAPGEIKLTARAEGLPPATVTIQSQPYPPRPYVP